MSFRILQDRLLDYLGEQYDGNNSLDHYKFLLNTSMQELAEETDWNFLRRRSSLRTMPPYSTGVIGATSAGATLVAGGATFTWEMVGSQIRIEDGKDEMYEVTGFDGTDLQITPKYPSDTVALYDTNTVAVTNGSATVTGAGTVFIDAMVGRYFHVAGDEKRYKIAARVSNTEITLESGYEEVTDGAASYNIGLGYTLAKSHYRVPLEVGHIGVAFIRRRRITLRGQHPYIQEYVDPDDQASGDPTDIRIIGHTQKALYSTGTVAVLEGNTTVTFATATLDPYFVGLDFRVAGDLRHYVIESVNVGLGTCVLTEAYRGEDNATGNYEIQPLGTPEVRLENFPVGDEFMVEYYYLARHTWLVNDDEMPLFPPNLYPMVYHKAHLEILVQENESGDKIQVADRRAKSLLDRAKSTHRMLHNKSMISLTRLPQMGHRRINPGMLSGGNWGW